MVLDWNCFPLGLRTRQGCTLSLLLFNIILELLARTTGHKKEIKGILIGKEKVKLSLFANDKISSIENPKDSTPKQTNKQTKTVRTNEFSKVAGYKVNMQKSVAFLHTNNKPSEKKIMKTIPFTIA